MRVHETAGIRFDVRTHDTSATALQQLVELTLELKTQMANIYKDAFGGYPWFEVFQCTDCGNYAPNDSVCTYCSGESFTEAYPIEDLLENYFPEMVMAYTPGVLILAENEEGKLEGFTTGGGITLGELIAKKYRGNERILASILAETGLSPEDEVYYENETCVEPAAQKKGTGKSLNYERLVSAKEQGFKYICGRTVNIPWLRLKEKQMRSLGYEFSSFIPDGDEYTIDGQRRYFFVGIQKAE